MKNIKYTWNLNNSNFTSIVLQYSVDNINWVDAETILAPVNIDNYTASVNNNAVAYRIVGNSPYSHCGEILSNIIEQHP